MNPVETYLQKVAEKQFLEKLLASLDKNDLKRLEVEKDLISLDIEKAEKEYNEYKQYIISEQNKKEEIKQERTNNIDSILNQF